MPPVKRPYAKRTERPYENRVWHRAGVALRRYSGRAKAALIAQWRATTDADDPGRLLTLMHDYDNGRLNLPFVSTR